jgi:F-type H+-transporting ATPase subunit a
MYHYSWFQLLSPAIHAVEQLGGSHDDAIRVVTAWGVCLLLLLGAVVARMGFGAVTAAEGYVPAARFNLTNAVELFVQTILGIVEPVVGKEDARRYFWLLGGTFLFIFTCNVSALFPGLLPPTDNINTNLAMALVVVSVYVFEGVRRTGMHFFKHLLGPIWWISPLVFTIEAAGVFLIRPMSLSIRLFANINGDHIVFGVMSDLVPVLVPTIFLAFGLWVSFLQAFVFTLLSTIYISLSVAHEDDGGHH